MVLALAPCINVSYVIVNPILSFHQESSIRVTTNRTLLIRFELPTLHRHTMCYFEQTQYLACGHNVELVTEKCELGERYRTSMHDKIITAIHSNDGQCEKCNPPPAYVEHTNGLTSDLPEPPSSIPDFSDSVTSDPSTNASSPSQPTPSTSTPNSDVRYPLVDLTEDAGPEEKRPRLDRKDSIGEDLMDVN